MAISSSFPNQRFNEINNTDRRSFGGNPLATPSTYGLSGFSQRHSGIVGGVPPHQNEKENGKDQNAKALHLKPDSYSFILKLFSLLLFFFLFGSFCKRTKGLSCLQFGNFTNSVKEQNWQWPMKEMGIGNVQLKEALQVNLELENVKLIQEAEIIEPVVAHISDAKIDHEKPQVPKASQIKLEMTPAEKLHGEKKLVFNVEVESSIVVSENESSESEALTEKSQSFKELHLLLKEQSYAVNFLWISLLFLILTVTAGFIYAKQLTVCSSSMPATRVENTHQERLSSRNLLMEVHMVGESCPYEMISFQRTISCSKRESKGESEVQSQERGLRKSYKKDSQTSSSEHSIGSPSYEKIHNKQVPNDSEYESKTIADQSLPPYDPITNYLASRPRFLYYNPNQRIERMRLRECMGLEECFTSESLSDTETSEETQPNNSFSVEEWQSEEVEESEAAMEEIAQVEPSVSQPRTIDVKVESKSYSFRLKPISLLFFFISVGALCVTIDDSPLISPGINSFIGKELRFTKLYEPAELTEVARTNYDGLTEVEELEGDEKPIPDAEVEELQGEEKLISNPEVEPEVEELKSEVKLIFNAKVESSGAISEPNCSESEALTENSQSFEELYLSLKENSAAVKVLGIVLLITVLTVAAAIISGKQQKSPSLSAAAIPIDQYLAKKLPFMATASPENTHQERLSSSNWAMEFDMVGKSCVYEMSSFQRTTSDHKRGSKGASPALEYLMDSPSYSKKESKGASEAQSQERRLRKSSQRESVASSLEYSMGSSYGSYISYEKISHKHGCGCQEVVIPVRRSCRIRNQSSPNSSRTL